MPHRLCERLQTVHLSLFLAFDQDGDGFLDLEEVYQAIHSLGKVWPMKDIREALPKDCKEVDFPGKILFTTQKVDAWKVNGPKEGAHFSGKGFPLRPFPLRVLITFPKGPYNLNFQIFWQ